MTTQPSYEPGVAIELGEDRIISVDDEWSCPAMADTFPFG